MKIKNASEQPDNPCGTNTESGFTILEVIISMAIFLIVTGTIWGILNISQKSRTTVNEKVQLTQNVRFALNIIGRDTYNAGFGYPDNTTVVLKNTSVSSLLGIPPDTDNTRDTVPPIIAGNDVTTNTFNTNPGVLTDQVTMLFKDSTFNPVGAAGKEVSQPLNINAATTVDEIDEIVPVSGNIANTAVNDILIVVGNAGSTIGVVTALETPNKVKFSNLDVLDFNQTNTGFLRRIVTPASMFRVRMVTYFTTPDGVLTRREFANNTNSTATSNFVDQPLVYGVENFQIQYVLDDGTLSDNPAAGPDGRLGTEDDSQAILEQIRQIRFTVSVRSTESDAAGNPYRTTMTTTFSTRNLGYNAS